MASSIASGDGDVQLSDQNSGSFFRLGKKTIFGSDLSVAAISKSNSRRPPLPKSWSQDMPVGPVAEILQNKRNGLIDNLKIKVKILAEESVTRTYIHEQSSNITALCVAVNDCLRFGLLQRKSQLFSRDPPTYALLKEVAKGLPEAKEVVRRLEEIEDATGNVNGPGNTFNDSFRRNFQPNLNKLSWIRVALFQKTLDKIVDYIIENASSYYERVSIITHPFDSRLFADLLRGPCTHDYTRIRTSDHLWTDPSACELMQRKMIYSGGVRTDPVIHTSPRASRFVCPENPQRVRRHVRPRLSLESGVDILPSYPQHPQSPHYRHRQVLKSGEHFSFWANTDLISPASLLYQVNSADKPLGHHFLNAGLPTNTESHSDSAEGQPDSHCAIPPPRVTVQKLTQAKDYVDSLHQNDKSPLLYGKNNVVVQPSMSSTKITGYLSVHKSGLDEGSSLQLKWAPNRAMSAPRTDDNLLNLNPATDEMDTSNFDEGATLSPESNYWDFALDIDMSTVVYVHCHRHRSNGDGGTVVLVRQDGLQHPPLIFPAFSQIILFLQCLETQLNPYGYLTPPLDTMVWDNHADHRNSNLNAPPTFDAKSLNSVDDGSVFSSEPSHFCFCINRTEFPTVTKPESGFTLLAATLRSKTRLKRWSFPAPSGKNSISLENLSDIPAAYPAPNIEEAFSNTFHTMQHQIISRVFYGWLAYTRSINFIRKRLRGIVYPRCLMPKPPPTDPKPLTTEFWQKVRQSGGKTAYIRQLYERIYFGGCDPTLRKEVWPFLLGIYPWSATQTEIENIARHTRMHYERSVSEWLAAEAIIMQQQRHQRQRDESLSLRKTPKSAAAQQRNQTDFVSAGRKRLSSTPHRSRSLDRQTVEEILTGAWNRMKRRISTATTPLGGRAAAEINGSNARPPDSPNGTDLLPPRFLFELESLKIPNNVDDDCLDYAADEGTTEDHTATTSDEDDNDSAEFAAALNLKRRLEIAQANSCPNSPPFSQPEVLMRGSQSSSLAQLTTIDCKTTVGHPILPPSPVENQGLSSSTNRRPRSRLSSHQISGATYSSEILEALSVNIHRIDKDVARCDRNYPYFAEDILRCDEVRTYTEHAGGLCVASLNLSANLYRLRTIMCTWAWQHMETGYVQGMCDLLAPLLVILDDEALTHACFAHLMVTMLNNFPLPSLPPNATTEAAASAGVVLPHFLESVIHEWAPNHSYKFTRPKTKHQMLIQGSNHSDPYDSPRGQVCSSLTGSNRIVQQFASLRGLIEVLDPILAEHMHLTEDNSHLYFYRWLLLDFKRELKYADVFRVWEAIWTSRRLVCPEFGVFIAFALIQYYRDIILFYCSDYADIIRFYNERAELHDLPKVLSFAQDLIYRLQCVISSTTAY